MYASIKKNKIKLIDWYCEKCCTKIDLSQTIWFVTTVVNETQTLNLQIQVKLQATKTTHFFTCRALLNGNKEIKHGWAIKARLLAQ